MEVGSVQLPFILINHYKCLAEYHANTRGFLSLDSSIITDPDSLHFFCKRVLSTGCSYILPHLNAAYSHSPSLYTKKRE